MQTPHQGESVDSAASQVPQKVSAIPGLTKKIMTALAALGIVASAEKVEGAVILLNNLPNSSISAPSKISGLANEWVLTGNQNSYLLDANRRVSDISNSRFTVSISPTDIGPSGGMLTITGTLRMSTSFNFDITNNPGNGYASSPYDLIQTVQWGNSIGTLAEVGNTFEILDRSNDSTWGFTTAEAYLWTQAFTATVPISAGGGTYYMDHVFSRSQTTGAATFENFTFNYANIPEPSTGLLSIGAIWAALLRRRREKQKD